MVYTLIDHRNDLIKCSKLNWNHEPQVNGFTAKFYGVISIKKREAKTLFIMSAVYGKLRKRTASYPFFRSKIQWGNHQINTHSLAPVNL